MICQTNNIWYPIIHMKNINKPDVLIDKGIINYSNSEIYKDILWYNKGNKIT